MRIADFLEEEGVEYDLETHSPAYTARALAVAEQARPHQVVKPVLVSADGQPVLCAIPADRQLDLDAVKWLLECNEVRLLDEHELAAVCPECELGAEPPVGRLFDIPTVMDTSLRDERWVYFQAGTHTSAVVMAEADWECVARPTIGRITCSQE